MSTPTALWVAIQSGPTTIEDRFAELTGHPLLDPDRLRAWTHVLAIAKYRPTFPRPPCASRSSLRERIPPSPSWPSGNEARDMGSLVRAADGQVDGEPVGTRAQTDLPLKVPRVSGAVTP